MPARAPTKRDVVVAGHTGDERTARAGCSSDDPIVRAAALGALERLGALDDTALSAALADSDAVVRRRAAEIAAAHPAVELLPALTDDDLGVVETAAWSCGEREDVDDRILSTLIELAGEAADALVRESAVAALGAIGDERAVATIVAAVADRAAVRRRAVLALAPFVDDGRPEVDDALQRALTDRNWQVRQAAEDLSSPP